MTYEQRAQGEPGFPREPDFRADNGLSATFRPRTPGFGDGAASIPAAPVGTDGYENVFDDGANSIGPDRLLIHMVWELVLLIGVGVVGYLMLSRSRGTLAGDNLRDLLVFAAALGLLAVGAGLSLRAGVPNLAVGPVAAASGVWFATNGGNQLSAAAGMTLLLALGAGAVVGVLAIGLHVPGWAASLGVGLLLVVWIQQHHGSITVLTRHDPRPEAFYIFGAVATLAVVGALLGAVRPIRRAVGRFRPATDPALRRGLLAGTLALVIVSVSGLFAGGAGVLLAMREPRLEPTDGLSLTALALGAVLLGGTSAFGRRGGIFGTLLAVVLMSMLLRYGTTGRPALSEYTVGGFAILIGLVVTRLVERFGGPADEEAPVEEDDQAGNRSAWPTQRTSGPDAAAGWTSPLAARPTDDTWGGAGTADTQWGTR